MHILCFSFFPQIKFAIDSHEIDNNLGVLKAQDKKGRKLAKW